MKRKIKEFLNGETGNRKPDVTPETTFSEKKKADYVVAVLEGGYDKEKDEFVNETVEVLWAEKDQLEQLKVGTTVIA